MNMFNLLLPLLLISAGFALFAGILFTSTGLDRAREPAYLPFGLLCLLIFVYYVLSAATDLISAPMISLQFTYAHIAVLCILFPLLVWFISELSKLKKYGFWLIISIIIFGGLFAVLVSPYRYLFARAPSYAGILYTSYGITLYDVNYWSGPFYVVFYVGMYLTLIWAIWRAIAMWRMHTFHYAAALTAFLILQIGLVVHDQVIILFGKPSFPYGLFVFLILVAIMAATLLREMRQRARELQVRTNELTSSLLALQVETDKRRETEAKLHHMAYHDFLTDLPNRRMLREILGTTLRQHSDNGQMGAIMFLDLDHFKTINDSLGHQVGDKFLQEVSKRLRNTTAEYQSVARLGGDEFAIIVGNLGSDPKEAEAKAMQAAEMVSSSITPPFFINNHELTIGTSIGLTLFPNDPIDVNALLRQADLALYSAKASGRNTAAMFASYMQDDAGLRLIVEKGLRTALDRSELKLDYQPQMNMKGEFIGVEALLRWHHPERGVMDAHQFIEVAEETGLIHTIGDYVLNSACNSLRMWDYEGKGSPPRVSLNISSWQLATPGFIRKVKRVLTRNKIDASRLVFEITENAVLRDINEAMHSIYELNSMGVKFAIDGFGTDYSALSSLRKLPLSEIKINKYFIKNMRLDPPDTFISAISSMAHSLGLNVVAEGVETAAQRDLLQRLGFYAIQGQFYSEPLDAKDFEEWLARHNARGVNSQTEGG